MSESGAPLEKLMSLSSSEFVRSIQRLAADAEIRSDANRHEVRVRADGGDVEISAEFLDGVTFGGLMRLPQCRVRIHFNGLDGAAQQAFLLRFDRTFQRGGG